MNTKTLLRMLILFLTASAGALSARAHSSVPVSTPTSGGHNLYLPVTLRHYFLSRVLEDFEDDVHVNWWTPDPQAFQYSKTSQRAQSGTHSFKVDYSKSSTYQFIGADPISPQLADFRGVQSLDMWVYGQVSLLLKLEGRDYQQVEAGVLNASDPQGWSLLQFDLSGLADQIDLSRVKLLFFPAPGDATASGTFYLDDLMVRGDS